VPQRKSLHQHQHPEPAFRALSPRNISPVAVASGFSGHGYEFASLIG
jgi:hypothetical protein